MTQPLAIDLFCGLGGWTEGLLAEGWDVVGFDIERHRYPKVRQLDHIEDSAQKSPRASNAGLPLWRDRSATGPRDMALSHIRNSEPTGEWVEYPGHLVLQDVLTLHGSQFRDADLIVASPPCQAYSYRAMPWSRAKALPPPDNSLFEACFRIQREACEAAGRHIPLIVENVRGAQKWVGRSRWNFGSFHLWGDVPALMPTTVRTKALPDSNHAGYVDKMLGPTGPASATLGSLGIKQPGISGPRNNGRGDAWFQDGAAQHGSKSTARKAASAMIAKIPFELSSYIARVFKPSESGDDDSWSSSDERRNLLEHGYHV